MAPLLTAIVALGMGTTALIFAQTHPLRQNRVRQEDRVNWHPLRPAADAVLKKITPRSHNGDVGCRQSYAFNKRLPGDSLGRERDPFSLGSWKAQTNIRHVRQEACNGCQ